MRIIMAFVSLMILYFMIQKIFKNRWCKDLSVTVKCNCDFVYEGEQLELVEVIENRKYLPISALKVKFSTAKEWDFGEDSVTTTDKYYRNDIFSVGSYEKITRRLPFVCKKRGYYVLGDMDIFASDFFYSHEYLQRQKGRQWVYVFPKRVHRPEINVLLQKTMGVIDVKKSLYEDPFSFGGIRDYQPFDSMKRVNWKASAKTGELKVNQLESTKDISVRIVLFFEELVAARRVELEEYCISLGATLAEYFLGERISVSLDCNGCDKETGNGISIGLGSGDYHMRNIDEGLARIDLEQAGRKIEESANLFPNDMKMYDLCFVVSGCQSLEFQKMLLKEKEERTLYWVLPCYEHEKLSIQKDLQENLVTLLIEN